MWVRKRCGLFRIQSRMQLLKQILPSCEEEIPPIGNIPERDLVLAHQAQFSRALAKEGCELLAVVSRGDNDPPFPLPHHFGIGSADLFSYIFLCPVTLFPFVAQQLIRDSSRCRFHTLRPLSLARLCNHEKEETCPPDD